MSSLQEMREYFAVAMTALETLKNAQRYIAAQFQLDWSRDVAQAHFDARAILFNHMHSLWLEFDLEMKYGRFADVK